MNYPFELHVKLLLGDQLDQFLQFVMIALLLGNVQEKPSQIAYIVPDRLIEIALQQARIVGYVKLIQRLHQMLLTQLRRGQTHHQRFSRKALLEQLLREKTKQKFIYWIIGN